MKVGDYQLNMLNMENQKRLEDTKDQQFKNKLEELQNENSKDSNQDQELKAVAQEFESLFVHLMLKEMRNSVPESDYLDTGLQGDIFEDMLDEEYAKEIASSEQLNLSKVIYEQLSKK
ncbi:rod-binding protein [Fuchsiella alkaliacetigena]|uniref:rod-binding protein n=1 Tax=Fuchsiella alkaliacetigena TaxID=957042 RepID=UPI00200AC9D5|nr:rod-binding protein [Fuchsiella alkaliacetigena]MCK8824569.1 rod-binding protein [Fuchsiella alkaliacetigena]